MKDRQGGKRVNHEAMQAKRQKAHLVAQHYASLGWAVTPGSHEIDKEGKVACSKHPTVSWKETEVLAGRIVGPTSDPAEVRKYWMGPGCDDIGADICIHAKPSRLVVVDCDRSWKPVVIQDPQGLRTTEHRFIDGLTAFLGFMDGEVGTELISLSKRGAHFFYAVDSDLAAKVRNRSGWLPGVDIRGGGESSGGVTVETNGVCPHRRWVRGVPTIPTTEATPECEIVGLVPYAEIEFDEAGKCSAGLPMMLNGRIEGIRPLPESLLAALLESSKGISPSTSGLRRRHRQAMAVRERQPRVTQPKDTSFVDARASASTRPYAFKARCACGKCSHFDEALELLAWVPPEVNYEAWRNVLWALSDLLGGSKCGEELGAEWSSMSILVERCDPDQARSIYRNDRRHQEVFLA